MAKKTKKKKAKKKVRSTAKPNIGTVRRKIDKLDQQIVQLLNERASLASQIGHIKDNQAIETYAPKREEEILEKVTASNAGPLSDLSVRNVFRELISGCRSLEKRIRVAFLGPEYTYSHIAVIHRFGHSIELAPVASISAVFEEVVRKQADFGLVPVENSTDGRITDTLEMFHKTRVQICGEVPLRIHHNLLGMCQRDEVRHVYSKPQALSQCRNWLAKHLPEAQLHPHASTSDAARLAREKKGVAAIASIEAAANYQLDVLATNIEDNAHNFTRFAVIGEQSAEKTGDDKTSLMFEVAHKPGSLADAMAIFKRNRLNLTWIESFPVPGAQGRYMFFTELHGHQQDLRLRRAIASLDKKALRLEILGSYARMDPIG